MGGLTWVVTVRAYLPTNGGRAVIGGSMEIKIRIFTKERNFADSRTILLNEGELDDMIGEYLKREQYLKEDEELESITYEDVRL